MATEEEISVLVTRIVVETGAGVAAINDIRAAIDRYKQLVRDMMTQTGQDLKTVSLAVQQFAKSSGANMKALQLAVREVQAEMKGMGQQTATTSSAFTNLGTVANFVFGTVLGISAVTAIRKLIDLLVQVKDAAIEFSRATFQLEVGVRALQRMGMNTTLETWQNQITGNKVLSTTVGELSSIQQAALSQAAQEFGIDYSGVTASTTLREVLLLANNLYNASRPYAIRGAGMEMLI